EAHPIFAVGIEDFGRIDRHVVFALECLMVFATTLFLHTLISIRVGNGLLVAVERPAQRLTPCPQLGGGGIDIPFKGGAVLGLLAKEISIPLFVPYCPMPSLVSIYVRIAAVFDAQICIVFRVPAAGAVLDESMAGSVQHQDEDVVVRFSRTAHAPLDVACLQRPPHAHPVGLGAVVGCIHHLAVVAQRELGRPAAWPGRQREIVAVLGRTGEAANLKPLQTRQPRRLPVLDVEVEDREMVAVGNQHILFCVHLARQRQPALFLLMEVEEIEALFIAL
ncbi:hypothetical protein CEN47_15700, partial [Fischerella thermalis CCMEE 5319]